MYLILQALNEDATLNNFYSMGSVKFVKDQALNLVLRLNKTTQALRYVPEATTAVSLTLKKSDNSTITKVGTFPFADDRSIIKFALSAVEMQNVISQAIVVNLVEPVAGTSIALLDMGLQIVKPEGC